MRVVLCNCPEGEGVEFAKQVIQEGWAACVNVIPGVQSVYRWEGALVEEREDTLLIKVAAKQVDHLRERLCEAHPYENPEVVVLDVDQGATSAAYLDWVRSVVPADEG